MAGHWVPAWSWQAQKLHSNSENRPSSFLHQCHFCVLTPTPGWMNPPHRRHGGAHHPAAPHSEPLINAIFCVPPPPSSAPKFTGGWGPKSELPFLPSPTTAGMTSAHVDNLPTTSASQLSQGQWPPLPDGTQKAPPAPHLTLNVLIPALSAAPSQPHQMQRQEFRRWGQEIKEESVPLRSRARP